MIAVRHAVLTGVLASALLFGLGAGQDRAEAASSGKVYGCYKVTTSALNIRRHAYSRSPVVAVAPGGAVIEKWRRFCALRGFWCPVRFGDARGHADKRFLQEVDCKS